jgi:hypothetical protein
LLIGKEAPQPLSGRARRSDVKITGDDRARDHAPWP